MDLAELQRKLVAAARRNAPSERVPDFFEQRVLARIRASPVLNAWDLWSRALWRAAAPCLGVMLLLAAWGWLTPAPIPPSGDLSQELENTVLAAVESEQSPDPAL